jgi:pilus assembly protein CpaF
MTLRERLNAVDTPAARVSADPDSREFPVASSRRLQDLRRRVHEKLVDRIDLARLQRLEGTQLNEELRTLTEQFINEEQVALTELERRVLVRDVRNEMIGFGPLETLLADPSVSDILVNTHAQVYVERRGQLELTDVTFQNEQHLLKIIDKIVSRVGRRIDESSPMVDARLPDGSRVNAIIPPLAIDGPIMSIRRFSATPLRMADLLRFKAISEPMAQTLQALAAAKTNLIISGGTGSGKTTLLNILSSAIPARERIVTIEDAAELALQQPHVVRLETRPPNVEGKGEINQRALVRNALRMRPDRVILGEVRGAEAFDMLQAMNTGHEGSMATVHANTPRDALSRIENMIGMAGTGLSPAAIRQQIVSAISVIVQVQRLPDGQRRIMSLQEVVGMEGDVVTMQELFSYRSTGIGGDGRAQGMFVTAGIRPHFVERLRTAGFTLPDALFAPSRTPA